MVHLEQEKNSLTQRIEQEAKQITGLETVVTIVQRLEGGEGKEPITLEAAAEVFQQLQVNIGVPI